MWQRMTQTGFEAGREAGDCTNFFTDFVSATLSAVTPTTGYYDVGTGVYACGHMGLGHAQMRSGWLCTPNGNFATNVRLFELFCQEADGNGVFYLVATNDNRWTFVYRDPTDGSITTIASTSIYVEGFNHEECIVAMGVTMKLGVSGHLSFYINNRRILTYAGALLANPLNIIGFTLHNSGIFAVSSGFKAFDDVYYDTSDGSEADACPPTIRLEFKRPTSAGSFTQWDLSTGVTHHAVVDDFPPDDTDFCYTETVSETELYQTTPAWTLPDYHGIEAVIPIARAKKGDSWLDSEIQMVIYDDSTLNESTAPAENLGLGFEYYFGRFTTDPNGDPWTESQAQDIESGFRSAGTL